MFSRACRITSRNNISRVSCSVTTSTIRTLQPDDASRTQCPTGTWTHKRVARCEPIRFSPYLYRARNLVEQFFNKIKQCRRVATRYDKLAANYLAFVKLAASDWGGRQ